jgi:dolichol-phosphate mannosyltransferase
MDRKVVEAWRALPEHETFFRGMSAWLGFRRAQLPFDVEDRTTGTSKWSLGRLFALSLHAIASFSARPLQAASRSGSAGISGGGLAIQTLVNWMMGNAASGFTTVILLELLIGGCVLLSLGLLGVYIARIFSEVKGRPRYIVSDTAGPDRPERQPGVDVRQQ